LKSRVSNVLSELVEIKKLLDTQNIEVVSKKVKKANVNWNAHYSQR